MAHFFKPQIGRIVCLFALLLIWHIRRFLNEYPSVVLQYNVQFRRSIFYHFQENVMISA